MIYKKPENRFARAALDEKILDAIELTVMGTGFDSLAALLKEVEETMPAAEVYQGSDGQKRLYAAAYEAGARAYLNTTFPVDAERLYCEFTEAGGSDAPEIEGLPLSVYKRVGFLYGLLLCSAWTKDTNKSAGRDSMIN